MAGFPESSNLLIDIDILNILANYVIKDLMLSYASFRIVLFPSPSIIYNYIQYSRSFHEDNSVKLYRMLVRGIRNLHLIICLESLEDLNILILLKNLKVKN
jgi:hypothetical protein